MFVAKNESNIAIAVIPKAGSQSIRQCCRYQVLMSNDEAMSYETRVAFIRNPVERLKSAYSFFHYLMVDGVRTDGNAPPHSALVNWEGFVDYALSTPNPHWKPQADLLLDSKGNFVPTTVHKFEDIKEHWEKYYKGALPWINASSRAETNDYRLDDIRSYYKEDFELWRL